MPASVSASLLETQTGRMNAGVKQVRENEKDEGNKELVKKRKVRVSMRRRKEEQKVTEIWVVWKRRRRRSDEEEGSFTLRLHVDLAYTHIHTQCRQQILITSY